MAVVVPVYMRKSSKGTKIKALLFLFLYAKWIRVVSHSFYLFSLLLAR